MTIEWIDVNDRLPEKDTYVLVICDGEHAYTGFVCRTNGWILGHQYVSWDYESNYDVKVTHWAYITPPKEV